MMTRQREVTRSFSSEISVILTAYNEGLELGRTINSIRRNTQSDFEVIVVDDGSTDRSLTGKAFRDVTVIRHATRMGVAYSRNEATRLAKGRTLAYLDGHQRLTEGCLDACADLAVRRQAIVCPDLCGFEKNAALIHGARFQSPRDKPPFGAEWKILKPVRRVTAMSSLRAPAYVIPAEIYPQVQWSRLLRGWGGSEGAISLKAFFSGVDIFHLCGHIAYHKFKRKFHYKVGWDEVWRNHAIMARICFSEETWLKYWLPEIFAPHLDDKTQKELKSAAIRKEHENFHTLKVRSDYEFWTRLIRRRIPKPLRPLRLLSRC
ncbi:MAG: glycosyltransferase family A protein [Planctomycetales bacterium]